MKQSGMQENDITARGQSNPTVGRRLEGVVGHDVRADPRGGDARQQVALPLALQAVYLGGGRGGEEYGRGVRR